MITVTLYSFAKRKNSTALPVSGTSSVEVSVLLKDGTSGENPVLELESNDPSGYLNYNYAYIGWLGRYYFITSRGYDTGSRIYLHLSEDYLGSFKSRILLSSGFIKYAGTGSLNIPDPRMTRSINYTTNSASAAFPVAVGGNNYFLCVTSEKTTETFYVSRNTLKELFVDTDLSHIQMSAGSDDKATIAELGNLISDSLLQYMTIGNIFQYLRSSYILPFPPDDECLGTSKNIYVGHYNTGVSAQPLVENRFTQAIAISIPWSVSDWRRCAPYTVVYLYLPFFGIIGLDTNTIIDSSYLTVKYSICYGNGDLSYSVETENNRIVSTGSTNVRSEYGLGFSNSGVTGFVANLASGAGNMPNYASAINTSLENGLVNILGSGLNLLSAALDSNGQGFTNGAGLGGFSACGLELRLKCWTITKNFTDTQANFATLFGYPVFRADSFASYTGFLQTEDFMFSDNTATANERDLISRFLNSGIYIE